MSDHYNICYSENTNQDYMSKKRSNFNNLSGIKLNAFETTKAANCTDIGRNGSGKITKYHKEGEQNT